MPTPYHLKRRAALIQISTELGLTTPTGKPVTSESQLLTILVDAREGYGLDWPHKMLEMIERTKRRQAN